MQYKEDRFVGERSGLRNRIGISFSCIKLSIVILVAILVLATGNSWIANLPFVNQLFAVHESIFDVEPTDKVIAHGSGSHFDWDAITPSERFVFEPCYEDIQCARLEVLMDRNNTLDNDKVTLAVIRRPAQVPVTDARYGGVVFLNPGGPGVPGTEFLRNRGNALQTILDGGKIANMLSSDEPTKFYDVISYDARGIGRSTPALRCFPDAFSRAMWNNQRAAEGLLEGNVSDANFERIWARHSALAQHCSKAKIARHMNTPVVATDIVEMIERYGEWRENETRAEIRLQSFTSDERTAIIKRTAWQPGHEKLQYWGFSYGTAIGATFATLYPNRVHRLVLDGVMDTEEYYSVPLSDLVDADAIVQKFAEYCHLVGPTRCALYKDTAAEIKADMEDIVTRRRKTPMVVKTTDLQAPDIITHSDLLALVFQALYNPYQTFDLIATVFADLRSGNGSILADLKRPNPVVVCPSEECRHQGPFHKTCVDSGEVLEETAAAVMCADGADVRNMTKEEYSAHARAFTEQSKWMGGVYSTYGVILPCIHWPIRPAWEYHGPVEGNTRHPILLVSTTLDPVCPIRGAKAMSARFPRSVLLEQNSEGHCSFSSPSSCTASHISRYFHTGALPPAGTVCLPESRPFGLPGLPDMANKPLRNTVTEKPLHSVTESGLDPSAEYWSLAERQRVMDAAGLLSDLSARDRHYR